MKTASILKARWLPWAILAALFCLFLVYLGFQSALARAWSRSTLLIAGLLVLVLFFLVYLVISRVMDLYDQRSQLQMRLLESEKQVAQAYQRLQAIFQIGQKFVEATDENEIIELVLRLSTSSIGAKGASFVPLDENSQPLAAVTHGDLSLAVMNPWLEYLASPAVREDCRLCEKHSMLTNACPLLKGPVSDAAGIFCLPLRRAEREYGVLNLYMSAQSTLDQETQAFLRAMVDETALALEGMRLRRRELAALRQMQDVRQRTDLRALLISLLESAHQSLEADAAVLLLQPSENNPTRMKLTTGEISDSLAQFIDGVVQGVMNSTKSVLMGDVTNGQSGPGGLRSYVAAPLITSDRAVLGAILVGSHRPQGFNQRQLTLLQTIAGHITLVVSNSHQLAELEYQAMMEERRRLAREIHDGLAQTLGFLKLQASQMKNYLARGEVERARSALDQYYSTLSEAYQDARQTIDGLRLGISDQGLCGWLADTVAEFEDLSGLPSHVRRCESATNLTPEIHAQLMRIVQEALSNVRKHAHANQVNVECYEINGDLILEIQDDGEGFSADDVTGSSRHGLRGIRERADLIGADFQIVSQPGEGTIVRLRMPLGTLLAQEVSP